MGFATRRGDGFFAHDHQKLIRETVRQFMEKEVRPGVWQRDREGCFPAGEIKGLAAVTFDQARISGIGLRRTADRKVES
jgi:hypothetical protein